MKNKRTIESLVNAVDGVVAEFKIEANELQTKVITNLSTLRELAGEYEFLFMDSLELVKKENEDLIAVIKNRIADHKEAKAKELAEQKAKIEAEAKAKAEREAAAKLELEAQAIRDKERAKVKAEQEELAKQEKLTREKKEREQKELEQQQPKPADQEELKRNIAQSKQNLEYADSGQARLNQQRDIKHLESQLLPTQEEEHRIAKDKRDQRQEDIVDGKFKEVSPVIGNHAVNNQGSAKAIQNSMAETMAKNAPTLSGFDMAQGKDETATLEMISVSKAEYDQLLSDSLLLGCLIGAGVDNWDGYADAQEAMESYTK
jgi:hypothetical protein